MSITRKDGSYIKQQRLIEISKEIARHFKEKNAIYAEILTWAQFELGLSEPRAKEYLDLVIKAKCWCLDKGLILDGC